jgi:hypothetical protein
MLETQFAPIVAIEARPAGLAFAKILPQFVFFTSPVNRCLSIFNTTPEFRSATSLTLYSAADPSSCAVSEGVNL